MTTNTTMTPTTEKAISLETFREIEYDIQCGVYIEPGFSERKWYMDGDIEVEVYAAVDNDYRLLDFTIGLMSEDGEEFLLEEGQWRKLYATLSRMIGYAYKADREEDLHIRTLWSAC